ncbi:MAG TPA: ABC transporter substrate-binding protein [Acidobacteriota bacterium]|nr:ABC transporter substrate-binding protein [Acidobacteriota bacterium]HRV07890.1 ABC transporter substrate-binding protein [Acidobacteriota bacterium]
MPRQTIHLAHSPDSDDAFMFYALAQGRIEHPGYRFIHQLQDIESLNQAAADGRFEITALSIHAYAYVADRYRLLGSGASMGDGYGPTLVAREAMSLDDLRGRRIAVPGRLTTAHLVLRLCVSEFRPVYLPFDAVGPAVQEGRVDAGVLIHEGQLTFAREGMRQVVDLGVWWREKTGLPLPLGGNAVRRNLPESVQLDLARLVRESVRFALDHREEALAYAMEFGRGLARDEADRFISMYVNQWTLDYGELGRRAVQVLLDAAYQAGMIPQRILADFLD